MGGEGGRGKGGRGKGEWGRGKGGRGKGEWGRGKGEMKHDICGRTFQFSLRIVKLCQFLENKDKISKTLAIHLLSTICKKIKKNRS